MLRKLLLSTAALLLLAGLSLRAQTPTVPAPQQTDQIITDPNGNSKADPGDKIRYKVTVQNTGTGNATGVKLNAIPDSRTTLDLLSFRTSPLAMPDGPYSCIGNVGITVPDGASDLLGNDYDDAPAGLTATAGTFATTQGGSITIAANGSFSYNPPRGYEGTDTYQYTLNDGNAVAGVTATDLGTVTITVSGMIWFINNNAGACASSCDGRMSNPYTTLAAFNTANDGVGLNPADNDNIFLYESTTAYTGGIVLRSGQKLFGQDATVTLLAATGLPQPTFGNALPVTNSANGIIVNITNAGGDGITLPTGSNTVRGLTVGNCSDFAIESSNAGTLTISETSINTTGSGFRNVASGILAVALGSLTSTGGLNAVNLTGTSGTFDVSGTTTASGHTSDAIFLSGTGTTITFGVATVTATGSNQAIQIQNNTGPVSFAAGSSVTGSSSAEILLNAGTGNVTYNGTVTNTSGGAISVISRTGGTVAFTGNISHTAAGNAIFANVNTGGTINFSGASKSINSSTATGVILATNTGATINFTGGGLVISTTTGVGFSATGGGTVTVQGTGNTIASTTGTALNVVSTTIGANGLNFQSISANGGPNGIVLNGSSGNLTVTGDGSGHANGSGGSLSNITGGVLGNAPVYCLTASGTITLKSMNMSLNTNCFSGMLVDNNAGGNITVNITGCTFIGVTTSIVQNKSLLQFEGGNTGGNAANVTANVQNSFFYSNRSYGMFATAAGDAIMNVTLNQSGFGTNLNTGAPVNNPGYPGGTITNPPPFSIGITNSSNAKVDYNVTNNTFWGADASLGAIYAVTISGATTSATSHLQGFFTNNKIGQAGTASSGCNGNCAGLGLLPGTNGTFNASVSSNDIRQVGAQGINFFNSVTGAAGTAIAHITDNTLAEPVTGFTTFLRAIVVSSGNSGGSTANWCSEVTGNNISGSWQAGSFIRITTNNTTGILTIPGLTPTSGATAAQVNAYIQSLNTLPVSNINTTVSGAINGGSPCPTF